MDILQARAEIEAIFQSVLSRVEPESLVRGALFRDGRTVVVGGRRLDVPGRLFIFAVGKASLPMARGALAALGDLVDGGVVVTKRGFVQPGEPLPGLEVVEAAHPVPDASSVAAGERLLKFAGQLGADDLALVLVSGGGSALVEAPREGLSLDDIADVTQALLSDGADIGLLNAVRRCLSRTKAGGLARAAYPAQVVNLIISDVLGNPLPVIASGLSVDPGEPHARQLNALLSQPTWQRIPPHVREMLMSRAPQNGNLNVVENMILADAAVAARDACDAAAVLGYTPVLLGSHFEGEAREFGRFWTQLALGATEDGAFSLPACLVGAGETTVTVRGRGRGGRNTEMALSAALELRGRESIAVASLATDGDDGNSGASGGVVVGSSVATAESTGLNPGDLLQQNDSARFLEAANGLIVTGPTGTNVNDLYLALIR